MGYKRKKTIYSSPSQTLTAGRISISRGSHPDYGHLILWDNIPDCTGTACPAYAPCHWASKDVPGSKCYAVQNYLRTVTDKIYHSVGAELTEIQKTRIGLELIPLYRTLIRLKLEEIGVQRVTYTTPKGMLAVHPIFKEIRETVKLIEATMSSIGVHDLDIDMSVRFARGYMRDPKLPNMKLLPTAAKSYYEMLEVSGEKKEVVVDLKRRAAE